MVEIGLLCAVSVLFGWILRGGVSEAVLRKMLAREYERGVGDGDCASDMDLAREYERGVGDGAFIVATAKGLNVTKSGALLLAKSIQRNA